MIQQRGLLHRKKWDGLFAQDRQIAERMMGGLMRQSLRAAPLQPLALPGSVQILMQHHNCLEGFLCDRFQGRNVLGEPAKQMSKHPLAHLDRQQIAQHFADLFLGQQLLLHQIDRACSRAKGGGVHLGRERGHHALLAARADFLFIRIFPNPRDY